MSRILTMLSYMTPGMLAGAVLFLALQKRRQRRMAARQLVWSRARECAMLLLWIYSGGMAAITLAPEPGWLLIGLTRGLWSSYFDVGYLAYRVNLIPFSQGDSLFNFIGNIVMFLPFGFFAALLWRGFTWKRAALLGIGVTAGIECWQILVGRYFDIDDMILNALGVLVGYLIGRLTARIAPALTEKFHVNEEPA